MRYFILLAFTIICLASSCKTGSKQSSDLQSDNEYESLAKNKLEEPIVYSFNEDSSYVLCQHNFWKKGEEMKATAIGTMTDAIVVKRKGNEVVFQMKMEGTITWHDKFKLRVAPRVGILDDNSAYLYDVSVQRRIPSDATDK